MHSLRNIALLFVVVPPLILFYLIYTAELTELADINVIMEIMLLMFKPSAGSVAYEGLTTRGVSSRSRRQFVRKIVAVGDLHGDFSTALKILRFSGVVDEKINWAGAVDFFVQMGDIMDRGKNMRILFEYMENLHKQAKRQGANTVHLLGSHEIMNLYGDWNDVTPEEFDSFASDLPQGERFSITQRNEARWKYIRDELANEWKEHYTAACRLPLHFSSELDAPYSPPGRLRNALQSMAFLPFKNKKGSLARNEDSPEANKTPFSPVSGNPFSHAALAFVHGGLSPTYEDLTPFPSRINALSRFAVSRMTTYSKPPKNAILNDLSTGHMKLLDLDVPVEKRNGPFWYSGWAEGEDEVVCAHIDGVLERIGARRLIMGHTIQKEGIRSRCDGKIILIDTAISDSIEGGTPSALSIVYTFTPVEGSDRLWKEVEEITALYPSGAKRLGIFERDIQGDFDVPNSAGVR